jgi:predicted DNA-binding transcriptional regulator AlpA
MPPIQSNQDLLSAKEIAARLSITPRTLLRMVRRGRFPQPIRFNRKLVRWRAREVQFYFDSLRPARFPVRVVSSPEGMAR